MGKNLHLVALFTVLLNLLLSAPSYGKNEKTVMARSSPVMAQNEGEESCSEDDEEDSITDRVIFLSGYISDGTANTVISKLLELDGENPDQDIYLYISSPGGSVYAGMAIYDAMQSVQADVVTISMGFSASMAAFLLAAGTPGKRFAFPHARVMIHQPFGSAAGNPEDLEIRARESTYLMNLLNSLLAFHTGQSITTIRRDTERDNYMSAMEAQNYGIIDRVIEQHPMVRSE